MSATVLTVILNWRTPDMTLEAAAAALREMEGIAGAITIVDNDSGDGSEAAMRAFINDVTAEQTAARLREAAR